MQPHIKIQQPDHLRDAIKIATEQGVRTQLAEGLLRLLELQVAYLAPTADKLSPAPGRATLAS